MRYRQHHLPDLAHPDLLLGLHGNITASVKSTNSCPVCCRRAMAALKPTPVPEIVTRTKLDGKLEHWLHNGCPALGGHMSVDEMRREHQALVPEKQQEVKV